MTQMKLQAVIASENVYITTIIKLNILALAEDPTYSTLIYLLKYF
jgi:hypothetical protein